jgi:hypothetical protein
MLFKSFFIQKKFCNFVLCDQIATNTQGDAFKTKPYNKTFYIWMYGTNMAMWNEGVSD